MSIDLSGALYSSLEKAKKEFEKAKRDGNTELAVRKAKECASTARALAKNVPSYTDMYLKRAEEWDRKAETVAETVAGKKVYERSTTGGNENDEAGQLKAQIESLIKKSPEKWDDIGGLEEVKQLMKETIVIAGIKKPDSIKPWKGILLYGPPGTGKTSLAAAAAGSLHATFMNVEAGKLLAKYFGESSKLVSMLYDVAKNRAPTIVFIDEFEQLSLSRDSDMSEPARRILASILVALDGFKDKKSQILVLTLAATNKPWKIDSAVLERFPQKIYVPLPDETACKEIIKIHTKDLDVTKIDITELARICVEKMYSGRKISDLCQTAMWNMVHEENPNLSQLADLSAEELIQRSLKIRPLEIDDFSSSFEKVKTGLTKTDLEKYEKWTQEPFEE